MLISTKPHPDYGAAAGEGEPSALSMSRPEFSEQGLITNDKNTMMGHLPAAV
jgi:hypothetical protein